MPPVEPLTLAVQPPVWTQQDPYRRVRLMPNGSVDGDSSFLGAGPASALPMAEAEPAPISWRARLRSRRVPENPAACRSLPVRCAPPQRTMQRAWHRRGGASGGFHDVTAAALGRNRKPRHQACPTICRPMLCASAPGLGVSWTMAPSLITRMRSDGSSISSRSSEIRSTAAPALRAATIRLRVIATPLTSGPKQGFATIRTSTRPSSSRVGLHAA